MENCYKYYYDNDGFTLHAQKKVWFTQCGAGKVLSLFEMLKIATDISTEDFRLRGMSADFLEKNGYARLVARSSFRIHRMPAMDEDFELITAEEKPEALKIIQTYEFKGLDGQALISGESEWMLVEPESRRIIPIKNFTVRTPNTKRLVHDCLPNGRIKRPENLRPLESFTVRPSALDGNGHVDNAWYAAFVMDSLPSEYQGLIPKDFRINYSRELLVGDQLDVSASFSEDKKSITLIGEKISLSAGEKIRELSFEAFLNFS